MKNVSSPISTSELITASLKQQTIMLKLSAIGHVGIVLRKPFHWPLSMASVNSNFQSVSTNSHEEAFFGQKSLLSDRLLELFVII